MRTSTEYIVVHCSATPPALAIGASEIDLMHRERGWRAIGYHLVIRRNGEVECGRQLDEVGAHTRGHNRTTVGVCLVGGVDSRGRSEMNFTPQQFGALRAVLTVLESAYPAARIVGHRDLSPDVDGDGVIERHEWLKDCPCFDVRKWRASGVATFS